MVELFASAVWEFIATMHGLSPAGSRGLSPCGLTHTLDIALPLVINKRW